MEGFSDLRLNRQEGQVNESFWPSFTDIMTVVVMIFMIAMVVLLIRNIELVRELRATMEAERVASELARATGEEKENLAYRLHQAQSRISELQLDVLRMRERQAAQTGTIAEQAEEIRSLEQLRDRKLEELERLNQAAVSLQQELDAARLELSRLNEQRTTDERRLAGLQAELDRLGTQLAQTSTEQQSLRAQLERRDVEIDQLRSQRASIESRYRDLVSEHDVLQTKYDRLIRPARSTLGRHLVEIRYWKEAGTFRISWREGDQGDYQTISRERLERVLTRLKREHENGLYVKIIFPEQSGLSYNEAFDFTRDLHRRFDYYFQDVKSPTTPSAEPARR